MTEFPKLFSPPGNLPELKNEDRESWSNKVSKWMDTHIEDNSLTHFINPLGEKFSPGTLDIKWIGFPKKATVHLNPVAQWRFADQDRDNQDEYLEWTVEREDGKPDGKILSVTFTCEAPEYWRHIATKADPGTIGLLELYQFLNPKFKDEIKPEDLFNQDGTTYCPRNKWNNSSNNGSIAHLIHPANTLFAEIGIAAAATIQRKDDNNQPVIGEQSLIKCSQYGDEGRYSDPVIGIAANTAVKAGNAISLADPVALYIREVDLEGLTLTSGDDTIDFPADAVQYVRGQLPHGLRLRIEIPTKYTGLTLSDVMDNDDKIVSGAQFAKRITMGLSVVAREAAAAAEVDTCVFRS